MPVLKVDTNLQMEETQRQAATLQLSSAVATMLGKPESYVMVMLRSEPSLCFAGTTEKCAYVELKSIGLPADSTKSFSAELCQQLDKLLGIPASRVYIEFSDAQRHLFGWNSSTF